MLCIDVPPLKKDINSMTKWRWHFFGIIIRKVKKKMMTTWKVNLISHFIIIILWFPDGSFTLAADLHVHLRAAYIGIVDKNC
jgi:hypothetical protein